MTHSRALFTHEKSGTAPQKRFPETVEIVDFWGEICYTIITGIKRVALEKIKSLTLKNPVISMVLSGAAKVWYRA